jgi:hypothetical protein
MKTFNFKSLALLLGTIPDFIADALSQKKKRQTQKAPHPKRLIIRRKASFMPSQKTSAAIFLWKKYYASAISSISLKIR